MSTQEFSSWLTDACDAGLLRKLYQCLLSPGTNRSSGVAILYKPSFDFSSCATDQHGRFVSAQFSSNKTSFQVCNIHGPNKSADGKLFFFIFVPIARSRSSLHSLRGFQHSCRSL